jgi:rhodanese-related sulfurtransferase
MTISRKPRASDDEPCNLPWSIGEDQVGIETTWGTVQPMDPVPGVRTVGELELVEMLEDGAVLVDSRVADSRSGVTLPGATHLPHDEAVARREELDPSRVSILFCNGPQCPQSPDALQALVDADYPQEALAYYRGGLHDWISLGYPTEQIGN